MRQTLYCRHYTYKKKVTTIKNYKILYPATYLATEGVPLDDQTCLFSLVRPFQRRFYTNKSLSYLYQIRLFSSCALFIIPTLFLEEGKCKCKNKYENLPNNSVLKRSDSFVNKRIRLSDLEVLQILYGLNSDKDIQNIFTVPDKLDVPGIYCFMSKDKSNLSYYIGSSVNMGRRYNRHMFNLNHKDTRNFQASPKFYSYVRKYGIESLDFGCLLVTLDYMVIFNGFDLSPEEISLLKSLTQLDLLLTEQHFLDTYGLSLNVAPYVGTRESSVLSAETRKKK